MDADEGSLVVILLDGVEVATRSLDGRRVDLGLVDALARLHLSTRLAGGSMVLRRPPPELCELLDLVGLAGVIEGAAGGLPLEAVGQAEEPEQLGIEEVLPGGDLPA